MKSNTKYPEYYCVDFEIFVKLVKEGNKVSGYNHLGNPYPVGKAIVDGQPITKSQYEKGVRDYLESQKSKGIKFQNWIQKQTRKFRKHNYSPPLPRSEARRMPGRAERSILH